MAENNLNTELISLKELKNRSNEYEKETVLEIVNYINFAAKPHPQKGASGAVCPFLPLAINEDTIFCSIITEDLYNENEIKRIIENSIEKFQEISLKSEKLEKYKTILLVFTKLQTEDNLLSTIHKEFKRKFIKDGLMIGDFYSSNNKKGLYSIDFNPLKSTIPMIAIRNLIKEDFPFLVQESDSTEDKVEFLNGYRETLKNDLNAEQIKKVDQSLLHISKETNSM